MRLRPIARFAAPIVAVVTGCDGPQVSGDPTVPGDGPVLADSGNPPPPSSGLECLTHVVPSWPPTDCYTQVCSEDTICCAEVWDQQCVDAAVAICPEVSCAPEITTATDGAVTTEAGLHSLPDQGPIQALDWADADGDLVANLITAGEGGARYESREETRFFQDGFHRAARWFDVDRDRVLDAVFAGPGGAYAVGGSSGTVDQLLVPAADGDVADLAVTDLDGDQDADLIVAFVGAPAALYRQGPIGVFARDPGWASALADHRSVELCRFGDDGRREIVLAGPAGVEVYARDGAGPAGAYFDGGPVVPGVGGVADVACGGLAGRDQLTVVAASGPVRMIDAATGAVAWSSADPIDAVGVDVGTLGGQPAIVVTQAGATGAVPLVVVSGDPPGVSTGVDPAPDLAAGPVRFVDRTGEW